MPQTKAAALDYYRLQNVCNMKPEIIKQMSEIVKGIMRANQTDFDKWDKESLADYNGEFIWVVYASGTNLCKVSHESLRKMVDTEQGLYQFLQRNTWPDAYLSHNNGRHYFIYDGSRLEPVSLEYAKSYWESHSE